MVCRRGLPWSVDVVYHGSVDVVYHGLISVGWLLIPSCEVKPSQSVSDMKAMNDTDTTTTDTDTTTD